MKRISGVLLGLFVVFGVPIAEAKTLRKHSVSKVAGKRLTRSQQRAVSRSVSALRRLGAAVHAGVTKPQYDARLLNTIVSLDGQLRRIPSGKTRGSLTMAAQAHKDAKSLWEKILSNDELSMGTMLMAQQQGLDTKQMERDYRNTQSQYVYEALHKYLPKFPKGNYSWERGLSTLWKLADNFTEDAVKSMTKPQ